MAFNDSEFIPDPLSVGLESAEGLSEDIYHRETDTKARHVQCGNIQCICYAYTEYVIPCVDDMLCTYCSTGQSLLQPNELHGITEMLYAIVG